MSWLQLCVNSPPGPVWTCHRQWGPSSGVRCYDYCGGCLDINWWPSSISAPRWLLGSRRHGKWDVRDCDHSGFWGTARLSTFSSFRRSYVIHSSHLGECPTITFVGSSLESVGGFGVNLSYFENYYFFLVCITILDYWSGKRGVSLYAVKWYTGLLQSGKSSFKTL